MQIINTWCNLRNARLNKFLTGYYHRSVDSSIEALIYNLQSPGLRRIKRIHASEVIIDAMHKKNHAGLGPGRGAVRKAVG